MPENKNIKPSEIKEMLVQITDVDIPFMSMIFLMVKWAFATIPAIIIIYVIIVFIIWGLF